MQDQYYNDYYENNKSGFRTGYLIYLTVSLVLVIGVLIFLWFKLDNYQKSYERAQNPEKLEAAEAAEDYAAESAAQVCFENYINTLSTDEWISLYRQSHPGCLDSDDDIRDFVSKRILPAKSSMFKASDFSLAHPKYILGNDDEAIVSVVLSGNHLTWNVEQSSILSSGENSCNVKAARGCVIQINGNDCDFSLLDGIEGESGGVSVETESADLNEYSADLVNPVTLYNVTINGLISPEPVIGSNNSFKTCDDMFYATAADTDGLVDKAENFIKALLKCYAQGKNNLGGNLSNAISCVESGSAAAKSIRALESGLEWTSPDNTITYDVVSSDVCVLADNCRFVEVQCSTGSVYRVFFLDKGNGYKIVQFSFLK